MDFARGLLSTQLPRLVEQCVQLCPPYLGAATHAGLGHGSWVGGDRLAVWTLIHMIS